MNPPLSVPRNMEVYTVVFLFPGPNYFALSDTTVPENMALHAAHLEAVRANIDSGVQLLAAPVVTPESRVSAMAVYRPDSTVDQITQMISEDPAVRAGRFTFEVHRALFPSLASLKVEY